MFFFEVGVSIFDCRLSIIPFFFSFNREIFSPFWGGRGQGDLRISENKLFTYVFSVFFFFEICDVT